MKAKTLFSTLFAISMLAGTSDKAAAFNPAGGWGPQAGLVIDANGNLFGTTTFGGGGACSSGCGTVFRLSASGNFTKLHSFNGSDGFSPNGKLIVDASGNLFGVTAGGGAFDRGTIFRLDAGGGFTTLHSFGDGNPKGSLIVDSTGNLFGVTSGGGTFGRGSIFRLSDSGSFTTLHSFSGNDGLFPNGDLLVDTGGNLYGTTLRRGSFQPGTIFRLDASGGLTTLHNFSLGGGESPNSGLVSDTAGNFYGTTGESETCGGFGCGTIFRLDTGGGFTTLHSFNPADGWRPQGLPLLASDGSLYGTTERGPSPSFTGFGTIFRLDTTGGFTTLHKFTGNDGRFPSGGLVADASGNLFGTTFSGGPYPSCDRFFPCGTIFRLDTTGELTTLHTFAVPEPTSWAMLIVGFGLAGSVLRVRRQVAKPKMRDVMGTPRRQANCASKQGITQQSL